MTARTFSHTGLRGVTVDNFGSGSIMIEPGDGDVVDGSLDAGSALLESSTVRQDGDQLKIILPQSLVRSGTAHLRLRVPAGLSYAIRTGSADVAITTEVGQAKISSGSGDITVDQADELDGTTGSGGIRVGRLLGRAARLVTGSGDIGVGEAHAQLTAKSGSGDITIRALHRELRASSGSGDIAVPSTSGSVDLRSASGSLTVGVAEGLPAWLDLSSVSGSVRIALEASAEPEPGEPYVSVRARTASGEISVYRA